MGFASRAGIVGVARCAGIVDVVVACWAGIVGAGAWRWGMRDVGLVRVAGITAVCLGAGSAGIVPVGVLRCGGAVRWAGIELRWAPDDLRCAGSLDGLGAAGCSCVALGMGLPVEFEA